MNTARNIPSTRAILRWLGLAVLTLSPAILLAGDFPPAKKQPQAKTDVLIKGEALFAWREAALAFNDGNAALGLAHLAVTVRLNESLPEARRIKGLEGDAAQHLLRLPNLAQPVGEPMRHAESVDGAEFSPDGRLVVTRCGSVAQLWEAATGKPVGAPMRHGDSIQSAHFSPDGKLIVTACHEKTAHLWDAASGLSVGAPLRNDWEISSAGFSPDGKLLVTTSPYHVGRLWEVAGGKRVGSPLSHRIGVAGAEFNADAGRDHRRGQRRASVVGARRR